MERRQSASFDIAKLKADFETPRNERDYVIGNPELPIFDYLDEIVESVRDHQVTIIVGETGSGKSTQVPQALLTEGHLIRHTQPRRIAAREVLSRVGEELRGAVPELPHDIVGFHTGERSTVTPQTRIIMETEGIEVAKYLRVERDFTGEVLILDEVHEAGRYAARLLARAHKILQTNPTMRLVIMSATMDEQKYVDYFADAIGVRPNVISVPGRTYPVEIIEEPNSTVAEEIIKYAGTRAGTLTFLPGKREIQDIGDVVRRKMRPNLLTTTRIYPLHSKVTEREQHAACNDTPESKVVNSTNVAQTSLTIQRIDTVIISGYERRIELDKRGNEGLFLRPISRADILQQAGRAGRMGPGRAIVTRLDADSEYIPIANRPEYTPPEIQNCDISQEVLYFASLGCDIDDFTFIDPISPLAIARAKEKLATLGALDDDYTITKIGQEMSRLPLRPVLGRMVVESQKYDADIQNMTVAMAAVMEAGGLPLYDRYASRKWKAVSEENTSDLIRQLDLFYELREKTPYELRQLGIDTRNLARAVETYEKLRIRLGITTNELRPATELDRYELRRCIYAGYIGDVYRRVGRKAFELLGDTENTYELSDRSALDPRQQQYVVGTPYTIERIRGGNREEVTIIEQATTLQSLALLGEAAAHLAGWDEGRIVWRNGHPVVEQRQMIAGVSTRQTRETPVSASEQTRKEIIEYALQHPGPAQLALRAIKAELETLQHYAKDTLPLLSHDQLVELVKRAASPNITDVFTLDATLSLIIQEEGITRESYVSDEEIDRIMAAAPRTVEVEGEVFALEYRNGNALVRNWTPQQIMRLSDDICLPDRRKVRFAYSKEKRGQRYFTVTELQTLLEQA